MIAFRIGLLIIAACVLGLAIWRAEQFNETLEAASGEREVVVTAFVEHVERSLQAADLGITAVIESMNALDMTSPNSKDALKATLQRIAADAPQIRALSVTDEMGYIITDSRAQTIASDLTQSSFMRFHRNNPSLAGHISDPVLGNFTGRWTFAWSRRISDRQGNFRGVIIASIEPDYFNHMFGLLRRQKTDAIGLWRADGLLLTDVPSGKAGISFADTPLFRDLTPNAIEGGMIRWAGLDGRARVMRYKKSAIFPIVITSSVTRAEIIDGWLLVSILYLVPAIIIATLLAGLFLSIERQREIMLARARDAIEATRAKSEFLAHMSHELRTPLNAILGFSEIMMTGCAGCDRPRLPTYPADIHSSGQHLLAMINNILDLAKVEAGRWVVDDRHIMVKELLDDTVKMMSMQAARRQVELRLEAPDDVQEIIADERILRQILTNMLSNAIKFVGAGGLVRLIVDVEAGQPRFRVIDNGPGIPPTDIDHILEPFGQSANVTRRQSDTGLGLPLCKQFAELLGGNFVLTSELAVGTIVVLTLPKVRLVR